MILSLEFTIPALIAVYTAINIPSPVIILQFIPDSLKLLMVSGVSGLSSFSKVTNPINLVFSRKDSLGHVL